MNALLEPTAARQFPSHFEESHPRDWLADFDPSPEEIQAIITARKHRAYKRAQRNSKAGYSDDADNWVMLLALEAGEVNEGVLSKVIAGGDRAKLHAMRQRAIARGRALCHALRLLGPGPSTPQVAITA